jgi:hypothetical protein
MTYRIVHPPFTPYRPGDLIEVLYGDDKGTALATIPVERCVALATNGRWRVTARRPDGKLHDVTVDADGNDLHGYASHPKVAAP